MNDQAGKLVDAYEAGSITHSELLIQLLQEAVERSPADIALVIPKDLLSELRDYSANPPTSPDECRVIHSVCNKAEFAAETHFPDESQRVYDGIHRWHAYFSTACG